MGDKQMAKSQSDQKSINNPAITTRSISFFGHVEKNIFPTLEFLIKRQYTLFAFSVICQTIEVFGNAYDEKDLSEERQSGKRFKAAIENLFEDNRYSNPEIGIYKELRCSLIHQMRPGSKLILASCEKDHCEEDCHFKTFDVFNDGKQKTLILVEVLFKDLKKAYQKLKIAIDNDNLPGADKFRNAHVRVVPLNNGFLKSNNPDSHAIGRKRENFSNPPIITTGTTGHT